MYLHKGRRENSRDRGRLSSLAVEIPFLKERKGKQWRETRDQTTTQLVVLANSGRPHSYANWPRAF
jgi:hypothetical protein